MKVGSVNFNPIIEIVIPFFVIFRYTCPWAKQNLFFMKCDAHGYHLAARLVLPGAEKRIGTRISRISTDFKKNIEKSVFIP
jgi:hypothetical protein